MLLLDDLLIKLAALGITDTCPLTAPRDNALTFLRGSQINDERLLLLKRLTEYENILCLIDHPAALGILSPKIPRLMVADAKQLFVMVHNYFYENTEREPDIIAEDAIIHPTAVIGVAGSNFVAGPHGVPIRIKHLGNAVIRSGVEIGPYTVIHCAIFGSTLIDRQAKIGSCCSIGHGAKIGKRTILPAKVSVAGSAKIGDGCWISIGTTIKDWAVVPDETIIGAGSLVLDKLEESGMYIGSPAKRVGDWKGGPY